MTRSSFATKYALAQRGKHDCARATVSYRHQLAIWTGGAEMTDPVECSVHHKRETFLHLAAVNDSIQEMEILYEAECLHHVLEFGETVEPVYSQVLCPIPHYHKPGLRSVPPPPAHNRHVLRCRAGQSRPQEIIRCEFLLDPVAPTNHEIGPVSISVTIKQ